MATVDFFLGSSTPAGFLSLFEPAVRPPATSFLLKVLLVAENPLF